MAVQPLLSGDEPVEHEGFLTAEFGRAGRGVHPCGEDERPYFCMVAFDAVHNFCWQLPDSELPARGLPAIRDWNRTDGPSGVVRRRHRAEPPARARVLPRPTELMDAETGRTARPAL